MRLLLPSEKAKQRHKMMFVFQIKDCKIQIFFSILSRDCRRMETPLCSVNIGDVKLFRRLCNYDKTWQTLYYLHLAPCLCFWWKTAEGLIHSGFWATSWNKAYLRIVYGTCGKLHVWSLSLTTSLCLIRCNSCHDKTVCVYRSLIQWPLAFLCIYSLCTKELLLLHSVFLNPS